MNRFWNWVEPKDSSDDRVLEIYGTIAEDSWFDDDVTPEAFRKELNQGTGPVTLWISSPGGDCIAASRIYTMLMEYPADITVKIDGLAASAASVIAMAGTKVLMAPTAMLMIHNPATCAFGDHAEMEKAIEMLDEVKESIITAYEIKTGLSHAQLSHMMDDETWMSASKAIEMGFADGMLEDEKKAANTVAFAFTAKAIEQAIACKISDKVGIKARTKQPEPEAKEPEAKPQGRSVIDLKADLYHKML